MTRTITTEDRDGLLGTPVTGDGVVIGARQTRRKEFAPRVEPERQAI
jgi:hypothetical protein